MVLCKFFQQGYCRFGFKCVNEHLDVKQMINTDVETAINGKQWPLSTYGPFRDKPSIPNFIEDQSFEEVRMLCYEAKQKNFFDQFHQQFSKEALEANKKMKALLQMSPDIVDVLISIYDTPVDTSSNSVSSDNVNKLFGLTNTATSNAGSIFAKTSNNTSSNNIFGSNNNNNTFDTPKRGLCTSASGFVPQQQQTSIFGQTSKPANSIFSSGNSTSTQQNTSTFGRQQTQSNIFASASQQQPTATTGGIFSQQNQFLSQPQQNSNVFKQTTQASQPQQGLFAQAAQTMQQQQIQSQQGLFTQPSLQTSAGQAVFAPAAQQTQNIFGQVLHQQQQTNSNIFQQNSGLQQQQQQQQQPNSNIFQQNQPVIAQQQIPNQQPPSGIFQQAALQMKNPGGQTNQLIQSSSLYSRLEDLTPDEIEAFKSDCFLPGKIPFNPPPRELI